MAFKSKQKASKRPRIRENVQPAGVETPALDPPPPTPPPPPEAPPERVRDSTPRPGSAMQKALDRERQRAEARAARR